MIALVELKFVPVIVTRVPPATVPADGDIEVIVGRARVNVFIVVDVPNFGLL